MTFFPEVMCAAIQMSADLFGEQTCIRQGKGAGGMKGISTNPKQVAVCIQSFGICSHLSQSLDDRYSDKVASEKTLSNRHKEEGEARRELDAEDRSKIVRMLWENTNLLLTESTLLYHIINGQVADEKVNVQDALKIGQAMCKKFTSSLPEAFNAPISHKVVTMKFQKKGMKVSGKVVCDLESLFARLLVVGGQRKVELSSLFKYELSPVPLSIIEDNGCLPKGQYVSACPAAWNSSLQSPATRCCHCGCISAHLSRGLAIVWDSGRSCSQHGTSA